MVGSLSVGKVEKTRKNNICKTIYNGKTTDHCSQGNNDTLEIVVQ